MNPEAAPFVPSAAVAQSVVTQRGSGDNHGDHGGGFTVATAASQLNIDAPAFVPRFVKDASSSSSPAPAAGEKPRSAIPLLDVGDANPISEMDPPTSYTTLAEDYNPRSHTSPSPGYQPNYGGRGRSRPSWGAGVGGAPSYSSGGAAGVGEAVQRSPFKSDSQPRSVPLLQLEGDEDNGTPPPRSADTYSTSYSTRHQQQQPADEAKPHTTSSTGLPPHRRQLQVAQPFSSNRDSYRGTSRRVEHRYQGGNFDKPSVAQAAVGEDGNNTHFNNSGSTTGGNGRNESTVHDGAVQGYQNGNPKQSSQRVQPHSLSHPQSQQQEQQPDVSPQPRVSVTMPSMLASPGGGTGGGPSGVGAQRSVDFTSPGQPHHHQHHVMMTRDQHSRTSPSPSTMVGDRCELVSSTAADRRDVSAVGSSSNGSYGGYIQPGSQPPPPSQQQQQQNQTQVLSSAPHQQPSVGTATTGVARRPPGVLPNFHHHHHHHQQHQRGEGTAAMYQDPNQTPTASSVTSPQLPSPPTGSPAAKPLQTQQAVPLYRHHHHHHHHQHRLHHQQQQQASQPQLAATTAPAPAPAAPSHPLVLLLLGFRGSGKSTQGARLAAKYNLLTVSSGDLYKANKQPFLALRDILAEHFGREGSGKYGGIVLDRFVAASEMDAYYVEHCLREIGLPLPMVFFLEVDPEVGMERASGRKDNKKETTNSYWRQVEQRVQMTAVDTIFKPSGCATTINCMELDADQVFERICATIDEQTPSWSTALSLVRPVPFREVQGPGLELVDDFAVYHQVVTEVHRVLDSRGRLTSAPLAAIGGYVDASSFTDRKKLNLLSITQVTLKVDGQRFLLVLHRHYGALAFPFMYACCYQAGFLFAGTSFQPLDSTEFPPPRDKSQLCEGDIDVLLDCELSLDPYSHELVAHVIDTTYFYGHRVAQLRFLERYRRLERWFDDMHKRAAENGVSNFHVVLKKYRPINKLRELLPAWEDAPVPIDGIVFQANDRYQFGTDKRLLKWKPQRMCTADFRLSNGTEIDGGARMRFDLLVSHVDEVTKSLDEVPYPHATATISVEDLREHHLGNSSIVELFPDSVVRRAGIMYTSWVFSRERSDKPSPNKYEIVERIVEMHHLTYEELLRKCADVRYVQAYNP